MRRAEKARKAGEILDELYPEQPIPLHHADPYTLLVAEVAGLDGTSRSVVAWIEVQYHTVSRT